MATSFTSLPVIDVGALKDKHQILTSNAPEIQALAQQLSNAFATSGFAYLTNLPLSFTHDNVFGLSRQFFTLPIEEKMKLGKRSFVRENENTYRG
jgi:isopenicillin N synthase-like dioxygenase